MSVVRTWIWSWFWFWVLLRRWGSLAMVVVTMEPLRMKVKMS